MLTQEDREYVLGIGLGILSDIAGFGTSSLLYGVFLLLFLIAVCKFYTRDARSSSAWASFGITVISFILASSYWIAYVLSSTIYLWVGLSESSNQVKLDSLDTKLFMLHLSCRWSRLLILLLADTVNVWRAWVLCSHRRGLMVLPCALLLGTYATSFAFLSLMSSEERANEYLYGAAMMGALNNAQGALSLLTNVSATLVIGYRLWFFRQDWKRSMGNRSNWSRAQSVMLIIAESGAIYAIYQLIAVVGNAILFVDDSPMAYFAAILYESHVQSTAMYPTIVHLIVHNATSIENMQTAVWNEGTLVNDS